MRYCVQGMDTYSNILFVKEAFGPLSHLAHRLAVTDKFTPEACCVIGNYYSLKVGCCCFYCCHMDTLGLLAIVEVGIASPLPVLYCPYIVGGSVTLAVVLSIAVAMNVTITATFVVQCLDPLDSNTPVSCMSCRASTSAVWSGSGVRCGCAEPICPHGPSWATNLWR